MNITKTIATLIAAGMLAIAALSCTGKTIEVTRQVPIEVTRVVQVNQEIEVTRQFPVDRFIPVTREVKQEVQIEVTRVVPVTRQIEVTRQVEVTRVVPMPPPWNSYQNQHELSAAAITVCVGAPEDGNCATGFFNLRNGEYHGHVFTNEHVVRGLEKMLPDTIGVYWHPARKTIQAEIITTNRRLDVAVLHVTLNDFINTATTANAETIDLALKHMERINRWGTKNSQAREAIWMAGYPSDRNPKLWMAPEVRDGAIDSSHNGYTGHPYPLAHSISSMPGSSGSLIINQAGDALAILTGGYGGYMDDPPIRFGIGTPLWAIYDWIDEQAYGWDPGQ